MIRQRSVPVSVEIIALPGPGNNNLSVTNMSLYLVFFVIERTWPVSQTLDSEKKKLNF